MFVLVIPWLIVFIVLVAFLLLFNKQIRKSAILFLLCFVLNYWTECFPLNMFNHLCEGKATIKVMTFNIAGQDRNFLERGNGIIQIIKNADPDILFITEYCEFYPQLLIDSLAYLYPYNNWEGDLKWQYFFSKYPIVCSNKISVPKVFDSFIDKAIINVSGDTISFYGCHLSSNNYTDDRTRSDFIKGNNINGLLMYFKQIDRASDRRMMEVEHICDDMLSTNKYPTIIVGDLNDICGSSPLGILKRNKMHDTWWNRGFGYGTTINRPLPYRIDHILYDENFCVNSVEVVSSGYLSDHNALKTEIVLK